jgi:sortase B
MNNQNKNNEPKKNLYVPDQDVLDYGKATKENCNADISVDQYVFDGQEKPKKSNFKEKFKKILFSIIPIKGDSKKKIVLKIVSLVTAVALIVSGSYIAWYFIEYGSQNAVISDVRNTYNLNRDDYSYNQAGEFSKFETLKSQNSDIIGWINIEGTEVDHPVYQTSDNDFYINHDMNKQPNRYGAVFLDYRCNIDRLALTQNQIVYGHHMRYGAMFGTLKNYRQLDYYKAHPTIKFDSLYESMEYKIFAMMIVNTTSDSTFGYNFSAYRTEFVSQEDFVTWTKHCKDRSLIDTNVDIEECDEVITLSTCCYDFDEARFVIVARRVRNGESNSVDVTNATMNEDVIYSKEYYDKKKLPIPSVPSETAQ